jgi:16S rRNA (cytosine967-C5)-methyltransferase
VDTAKKNNLGSLAGLINAVLRRLIGEGEIKLKNQDAPKLNAPHWLWQSWLASYGEEIAYAIAEAHMHEAPLDFSVKSNPEAWAEKLGANIMPTGTLRRQSGGLVSDMPGYQEGEWWIQDLAAALPVKVLGDVSGHTVLDLCAAPGGKTAQLIAGGAKVIAIDQSKPRIQILHENLRRLKYKAETIATDAIEYKPRQKFTRILLDAPCTATGTIRKHPDIAWSKKPIDVKRLAGIQWQILENALQLLAPGGILVYAACSLQVEEGPDVIEKALKADPTIQRFPIKSSEIGDFADIISKDGDIRTLPCDLNALGGMDGFFIARLQRAA